MQDNVIDSGKNEEKGLSEATTEESKIPDISDDEEDEFSLCTFDKSDVFDETKLQSPDAEEKTDDLPIEEEPKRNAVKIELSERTKKTCLIVSIILIAVLAIIYAAGTVFYSDRFFAGTKINGFNCSNMTVDEARESIKKGVQNYEYILYERKGVEEKVVGKDIELNLQTIGNLNEVKARQSKWLWPFALKYKNQRVNADVTMNEDLLYQKFTEFKSVQEAKKELKIAAEMVIYDEGTHRFIINNDYNRSQTAFLSMKPVESAFSIQRVRINRKGDIVNINKLWDCVKAGMYGLYPDMNLDTEGCYVDMAEEESMKTALETMNKYISANVTYTKGEEKYYLDGGSIHFWVSVNGDFAVSLDENGVTEYVKEVAAKYNTTGSVRDFKTSTGIDIKLDPGDYGWKVDIEKESKELCEIIRNGDTAEREPVFAQKGMNMGSSDIGNTFVEVSIKEQCMWFYKNGELIVRSNCVTGNPYAGNATHLGVWKLKYKERDSVLVGDNYRTPVSYWMPFNGGEGLHDANWRGAFGGNIYLGGGSHGCVNLPPDVAAKLYENIEPGTPVVIY